MTIPLFNPLSEYRVMKGEIDEVVTKRLESGRYARDYEAFEALEQDLYDYTGLYAVLVGSGTAAIEMVAKWWEPVEIHLPDPMPPSVINVFQELRDRKIVGHVYKKAAFDKPAFHAHIYGYDPPESDSYLEIEDVSQAFGSWIKNETDINHDYVCSCYPTKPLAAMGEAGIILTPYKERAEGYKRDREYGWSNGSQNSIYGGTNYRPDPLQADILRVKLRHIDNLNESRNRVARIYYSGLSSVQGMELINTQDIVKHLFPIAVDDPRGLRDFLAKHDIQTGDHYPGRTITPRVTLPFHTDLELSEIEKVISLVTKFVQEGDNE